MIYDFLSLPDLLFFGERSDLAYSDFCNSAKSERGCGDFTAKLICGYIVSTKSKLATSCGGQFHYTSVSKSKQEKYKHTIRKRV